ncbi:MAG: hypothetical protein MZV63_34380 [Marinilabiliales bacterium]|nr:hypothetical protein [Marinilabiliales bacterium]
MIDAQLTTEIFGLFAPARPDIAIENGSPACSDYRTERIASGFLNFM